MRRRGDGSKREKTRQRGKKRQGALESNTGRLAVIKLGKESDKAMADEREEGRLPRQL